MKEKFKKFLEAFRIALFIFGYVDIAIMVCLCFEALYGRAHDGEFIILVYLFILSFLGQIAIRNYCHDKFEDYELSQVEYDIIEFYQEVDEKYSDMFELILLVIIIGFLIWLTFSLLPLLFS